MEIIVAKTAGFCFGVDRAVELTYKLLEEKKMVATLGPLIHNPQCVADLKQKGVKEIKTPKEIESGYEVVIRSHGVAKNIYDELQKLQVKVHDATCPFVAKIHKIVEDETQKGRTLLVAGYAKHPEIEGITGHANGAVFVFNNIEELQEVIGKTSADTPISVIAQTTFEVAKWEECIMLLKKYYTNATFFDTICSATWTRQQEAEELSRTCDIVIIVGGKHSSNTQKLLAVCEKNCRAVLVETASELNMSVFKGVKKTGLTAGASTPLSIIEEVLDKMNEEIRDVNDEVMEEELSFEEMLEASLKPTFRNQKVKGIVTGVSPTEVIVDIGTKHTGFIPLDEFDDRPTEDGEAPVKKGDELDLVVVQVNDQEGTVMLSKKKYDMVEGFEQVKQAAEDGTVLTAYVQELVKDGKGLVSSVKGVRIFIPASQATSRRGEDLSKFLKTNIEIKILEFDKRRAIGSIRAVSEEETNKLKEAFWAEAEVGKEYTGIVKSLTTYGAFVDIGGVDGLLHISELSWNRIKHPSEIVNEGDTITVRIKELDAENHKISLGYKKEEDNPWKQLEATYPVGSVFTGKVASITSFGAFVNIMPGIDGLVHISEIAKERIEKVGDVLSVGQEVEVQLTEVDFDKKRISLSMKALLPQDEPAAEETLQVVATAEEGQVTIDDAIDTVAEDDSTEDVVEKKDEAIVKEKDDGEENDKTISEEEPQQTMEE